MNATELLANVPAVTQRAAPAFSSLIAAATRAPSGDNLQPWRFVAEACENTIDVHCDTARDPSPLSAGQRMSRIACGAALENLLLVAAEQGWRTRLDVADEIASTEHPLLARVVFLSQQPSFGESAVAELIAARVTNRRFYNRLPVPHQLLNALRLATPARDGTATHWITSREQIGDLAGSIAASDAAMFGEAAFRNAFLNNVRFDLPAKAAAESGLPLGALELSLLDRMALKTVRAMPSPLLRITGASRSFASHARKLVASSSGLCIVTADADGAELHIGRAMQRAWLALTKLGLCAQPMMSCAVLDNALRNGAPDIFSVRAGAETAVRRCRASLLALGIAARPRFILRFGYAAAPSGRTGRLDLTECTLPPSL
jgi:hypothetical protein